MRNKFYALIAFGALFLNAFGAVSAQTKIANQPNRLAALLPASDGVMTLDVQRLLNESVPQVLSGKPQMLADINQKIDEIRDKTGLDARQFEQIAIGVAIKQITAREVDLEPIFLARGKYNANALIAVAKLASKGKYREEKSGSRTIYVFDGKEMVAQNKPTTKNSWFDKAIDRLIIGLTKEIAVTSLDDNTLAFGSLARVRETFETKSRISSEVLNLANRRPNAVVSFGAKLPNGLSNFFILDNDELGKTLDSIRQISGAVEISDGNSAVSMAAKTLNVEQAQNLHETLQGLQMLGKAFIGGGKGEDKKVYARMIENAKITRNSAEVVFDLQVPQTDINILLAGIK
ncbi:MAG: hypothetical protein LH614_22645 [Pyrinomonadaceae bacterium]|nr:hypothetical protein [Pyrinomonadaceae bacterium]